jgi:hypothetical protein
MGGTSKQTQDVSQTTSQAPYGPAIPLVSGVAQSATNLLPSLSQLTPEQQQAIAGLTQNANAGNPYAGAIGGYATNLLGGGGAQAQAPMLQNALTAYQNQLNPIANQNPGQISPQLQSMLDTLTGDITNKTNAYYAGAGRDLSGANAQNLTRGLASGLAPALLGQYNQNIQNQMGAAGSLYGAANQTGGLLSGLSQTALANQGTGVDAATAALAARDSPYNQLLAIQSAAQGIPLGNLAQLSNIGSQIGQLGGTGTKQGTVEGTTQMSPAQQAWGWMNAFANLNKGFGG